MDSPTKQVHIEKVTDKLQSVRHHILACVIVYLVLMLVLMLMVVPPCSSSLPVSCPISDFGYLNVSLQVRKGTQQEAQTIAVTKDLGSADDLFYVLSFGGEVTGPILAHPSGSCESTESEVQVISTATSGESQ